MIAFAGRLCTMLRDTCCTAAPEVGRAPPRLRLRFSVMPRLFTACLVLLVFALAALPQRVQAAANFVYHEQSTRSALEDATSTDCSTAQPYLDLLAPSSTQA